MSGEIFIGLVCIYAVIGFMVLLLDLSLFMPEVIKMERWGVWGVIFWFAFHFGVCYLSWRKYVLEPAGNEIR